MSSEWLQTPGWFLAAAALLVLAALLRRPEGARGGASAVGGGADSGRIPRALWFLLLAAAAWIFSGPGIDAAEPGAEQDRFGVSVMHVLDVSGSMNAIDFAPGSRLRRIEGAREALAGFIEARAGDLQGLMVFGDRVQTLVPLTHDTALVAATARRIDTGIAGDGTAIGDAVALAARRLQDAPTASRVMVFASDGVNNAGELQPMEAVRYAAGTGIRIHVIGIGETGEAPVRIRSPFGDVVRNLWVEIDEEALREIARRTNGQYFRADDAAALEAVYAEIDRLERSRFKAETPAAPPPLRRRWLLGLLAAAGTLLGLQAMAWRQFPWA